jgi:hypothetical protein
MNARHEHIDIEDDGFQTVEFHDQAYWLQQDIYRYERMVNKLFDALKAQDWWEVEDIIRNAHSALHGPRE